MTIILLIVGAIGVLLGGLWLLQGLGLVQIAPILCVANCETIEGPTPTWAIVGLLVLAAGCLAIFYALRRRRRSANRSRR